MIKFRSKLEDYKLNSFAIRVPCCHQQDEDGEHKARKVVVLVHPVANGKKAAPHIREVGHAWRRPNDGTNHKLRKREDWTVRRFFLSRLIDHMMTKYIIKI
jgi:hypothetical protein